MAYAHFQRRLYKYYFLTKNINRTFLHSFKNGARRQKNYTFLHEWLAMSVKKCKFYP